MKTKIKGGVIEPRPLPKNASVVTLVDDFLPAYNGARLREACQLMVEKVLRPGVTLGVSITGALTPPGFGTSVLAPMVQAGFIDYIVSTGANLYHDLHHALGLPLHRSSPFVDDRALREQNVVRIYDIVFDFEVLLRTDRFCYEMLRKMVDAGTMSSSELHHRLGALVAAAERKLRRPHPSLLAAAYRADVPIYTSSPGDSTIGMNLAALRLRGGSLAVDPSMDVNETAALVYGATRGQGKSAVLILGGGSPKNFMLQTEPQIQEILGLTGRGHDHFIQITDARPDTGGLSGATPSEAVSWGKIDPDKLPDTVVVYADTSLALPILGAYALARAKRRPLKRLYKQREALVDRMRKDYLRRNPDHAPAGR
jgi:deoxyhypusine synthase